MATLLNFRVELTMPAAQGMSRDIVTECLKHLSNVFNAVGPVVATKVEDRVSKALRTSDAWASIVSGELQDVLCIPNPSNSLYQIERAVVDSISIIRRPVSIAGMTLSGGFEIGILTDNYNEVISAGDVAYATINGKWVPWVEWLLFSGTQPVLSKAKLVKTSRGVVAARADKDLAIPPAHAGVQTDNFLTRALSPLEAELGQIIQDEVSRRS